MAGSENSGGSGNDLVGWWTVSELTAACGVPRERILVRCRNGTLEAIKTDEVSPRWLINPRSAEALLARYQDPLQHERSPDPAPSTVVAGPWTSDAPTPSQVIVELAAELAAEKAAHAAEYAAHTSEHAAHAETRAALARAEARAQWLRGTLASTARALADLLGDVMEDNTST